jgi:hypothetical protein
MKSEGIPDLLIRRSLGVVGAGPPPIPKFIDVQEAMVRPSSPQDHELPSSDNFEPAHDDLSNPLLL